MYAHWRSFTLQCLTGAVYDVYILTNSSDVLSPCQYCRVVLQQEVYLIFSICRHFFIIVSQPHCLCLPAHY